MINLPSMINVTVTSRTTKPLHALKKMKSENTKLKRSFLLRKLMTYPRHSLVVVSHCIYVDIVSIHVRHKNIFSVVVPII